MKTSLKKFVADNNIEIDEFIREKDQSYIDVEITGEIREYWVKNNVRLNTWAQYENIDLSK